MGVTWREPNLVGCVYQILDMPYIIYSNSGARAQFGAGRLSG